MRTVEIKPVEVMVSHGAGFLKVKLESGKHKDVVEALSKIYKYVKLAPSSKIEFLTVKQKG